MKYVILIEFDIPEPGSAKYFRQNYIVDADNLVAAMSTLEVDWTLVRQTEIVRIDAEVKATVKDLFEELADNPVIKDAKAIARATVNKVASEIQKFGQKLKDSFLES